MSKAHHNNLTPDTILGCLFHLSLPKLTILRFNMAQTGRKAKH